MSFMVEFIGWVLVAFIFSISNNPVAVLRILETSEKAY